MSEERFLSLEDVADRLQLSGQTVRRWVKSGKLTAYKPGLEYRIREEDLEEFLRRRAVRPKAQAPPPPERGEVGQAWDEKRRGIVIIALGAFNTAERWRDVAANPDSSPRAIEGAVEAAVTFLEELMDLLEAAREDYATEEEWLINHPRAFRLLDRLAAVYEVGNERLAKLASQRVPASLDRRRQEQIREWTRRSSA